MSALQKNTFTFHKLTSQYRDLVMSWLDEPHVREFWDNGQDHRDDIDHFIGGRVGPSQYFNGAMTYWIGCYGGEPFCFLLTSRMESNDPGLSHFYKSYLASTGNTTTLDFCIGNKTLLGKGLAAETLVAFMDFFTKQIDPKTQLFFIDPNEGNPRAQHVYKKAGFREVIRFQVETGYFEGHTTILMTRRVYPEPKLLPAGTNDIETLQNLSKYYVYDISRCGAIEPLFDIKNDGTFKSLGLEKYIKEQGRSALLIYVGEQLAGFVLLHIFDEDAEWTMAEFFILARYQGQGIARKVALQVFDMYPGSWMVSGIPENTRATSFWEKVISEYTDGNFARAIEPRDTPGNPSPRPRVVWRFATPGR